MSKDSKIYGPSHMEKIESIFDENTNKKTFILKQQKINENFCSECLTEYYLQENQKQNLLKIFLNQPITCFQAIETVLNFLENEILIGRRATEFIEEIHVKIFNLRFSIDSDLNSNFKLLKKIGKLLFELLETQTNSISNLLELIPIFISTCQFIEKSIDNTSNYSSDFISELLDIEIPTKYHLYFLKIFSEIEIDEEEFRFSILNVIKTSMKSLETTDSVGLVKLILSLSEKYQTTEYLKIIRPLISTMSNDLRLNTFYIIELSFKHSNQLLKLLLEIISEIYKDDLDVNDMDEDIYVLNDLLLLFLASNNELQKENIFDCITKVIENLEKNELMLKKYFNFPVHSLNSNSGSSEIETYSFIQNFIIGLCGIEYISNNLFDIACLWCNNPKNVSIRQLGASAIVFLFCVKKTDTHLNFTIFKHIFNVISEDPNLTSKFLMFSSLEKIVKRNKTLLLSRDYMNKIQELFGYVSTFQLEVGKKIISIFLPLVNFSDEFQNFLIVMFKKLIIRRNQDNRILAIFGFCSLLSLEIGKEIFSNLQLTMKYPTSIRSNFYENLNESIPNIENRALLIQIKKMLLPILEKYTKEKELHFFSLFEQFTIDGDEKKVHHVQKESIHKLIQCLMRINEKLQDVEMQTNIDTILSQLCDFKKMMSSFLTDKYKVPRHFRNNLIFQLYDVFLEYSLKIDSSQKFDLLETYSIFAKYFKYNDMIESNMTLETSLKFLNKLHQEISSSVQKDHEIFLNLKERISLFSIQKLIAKIKMNLETSKYQVILQSEKYSNIDEDVIIDQNEFQTLINLLIPLFRNLFRIDNLLNFEAISNDDILFSSRKVNTLVSKQNSEYHPLRMIEEYRTQTMELFRLVLEKISFKNSDSYNYFFNQIFNPKIINKKLKIKQNLNFQLLALYFAKVVYEYTNNGSNGVSMPLFLEYIKMIKHIAKFSQDLSNSIEGEKISAIIHAILCEHGIDVKKPLKLTLDCLFLCSNEENQKKYVKEMCDVFPKFNLKVQKNDVYEMKLISKESCFYQACNTMFIFIAKLFPSQDSLGFQIALESISFEFIDFCLKIPQLTRMLEHYCFRLVNQLTIDCIKIRRRMAVNFTEEIVKELKIKEIYYEKACLMSSKLIQNNGSVSNSNIKKVSRSYTTFLFCCERFEIALTDLHKQFIVDNNTDQDLNLLEKILSCGIELCCLDETEKKSSKKKRKEYTVFKEPISKKKQKKMRSSNPWIDEAVIDFDGEGMKEFDDFSDLEDFIDPEGIYEE
eukprot:gene12164-5654_t